MEDSSKAIIIIDSEDFVKTDIRDIISFLLYFTSKFNFKTENLFFYDLNQHNNYLIKFLELIKSKNLSVDYKTVLNIIDHADSKEPVYTFQNHVYEKINENFLSKEIIYEGIEYFLSKNNLDTSKYLFRKNHEKYDKNISSNFFLYISGFSPEKPKTNAHILAPKWEWLSKNESCISGVNFVGHILKDHYKISRNNNTKEFRSIYVGSSSLNKNSIMTIIFLMISRVYALIRRIKIKPDKVIVTKFYGFKGTLVWFFVKLIKYVAKLLMFQIDIDLKKNKFSNQYIYNCQSNSDFGLITYFKEGFPRVLGEYIYLGSYPLIWTRTNFGDCEVKPFYKFKTFKEINYILTNYKKDKFLQLNQLKGAELLNAEVRVRNFLNIEKNSTLKNSLNFFPEDRRLIIFYTLLTADTSYLNK